MFASAFCHHKVVEVLTQTPDIRLDLRNAAGFRAQDLICSESSAGDSVAKEEITKHLYRGSKILYQAASSGRLEDIRKEIRLGADLEWQCDTDGGDTALIVAAAKGYTSVVQALLAHGANPNLPNFDGETALSVAISGDLVDVLIAKGADPDMIDESGNTALIRAASYGWTEVALALVAGGADKDKKNALGRTALDNAKERNDRVLIEALDCSTVNR